MLGLKRYPELAADVRYTGKHEHIKELVQVDEPEVREIARVLVADADFISACQEFVHSFTTYGREIGDYWRTPAESLERRQKIDCDDSAILLCSLLRNYIPPEKVFCAIGTWNGDGHMWVVTEGENGDRILESTASPKAPFRGNYNLQAMFNDKYVLATNAGLVDFDLKTVGELVPVGA